METTLWAIISSFITKTNKAHCRYLRRNQKKITLMAKIKRAINSSKNYISRALLAKCYLTRQQKTMVKWVYISLSKIASSSASKHWLSSFNKLKIWGMETHILSLVSETIKTQMVRIIQEQRIVRNIKS